MNTNSKESQNHENDAQRNERLIKARNARRRRNIARKHDNDEIDVLGKELARARENGEPLSLDILNNIPGIPQSGENAPKAPSSIKGYRGR